jgi:hypothetical protein
VVKKTRSESANWRHQWPGVGAALRRYSRSPLRDEHAIKKLAAESATDVPQPNRDCRVVFASLPRAGQAVASFKEALQEELQHVEKPANYTHEHRAQNLSPR